MEENVWKFSEKTEDTNALTALYENILPIQWSDQTPPHTSPNVRRHWERSLTAKSNLFHDIHLASESPKVSKSRQPSPLLPWDGSASTVRMPSSNHTGSGMSRTWTEERWRQRIAHCHNKVRFSSAFDWVARMIDLLSAIESTFLLGWCWRYV
jgi:hypothetical protein